MDLRGEIPLRTTPARDENNTGPIRSCCHGQCHRFLFAFTFYFLFCFIICLPSLLRVLTVRPVCKKKEKKKSNARLKCRPSLLLVLLHPCLSVVVCSPSAQPISSSPVVGYGGPLSTPPAPRLMLVLAAHVQRANQTLRPHLRAFIAEKCPETKRTSLPLPLFPPFFPCPNT